MPFHMHFSLKEYCKLRIKNRDSNTDLVSCWHKFSFPTGIFFSCNICVRKSYIWLSLWWVLSQTSWSRYLQINEDKRQVDLQSQLVYQQKFYVRNICMSWWELQLVQRVEFQRTQEEWKPIILSYAMLTRFRGDIEAWNSHKCKFWNSWISVLQWEQCAYLTVFTVNVKLTSLATGTLKDENQLKLSLLSHR